MNELMWLHTPMAQHHNNGAQATRKINIDTQFDIFLYIYIYISVVGRSKKPVKSMVVGRPILLALEDIDGSPSFLEKALCFIERYGIFDSFIFFKFQQIPK